MAYQFYIDKILLPVAPAKLEIKIGNKNEVCDLLSGEEINRLKSPELTEISFEALLPISDYPFSSYGKGESAATLLKKFYALKTGKKTFQFIILRKLPGSGELWDTNIKCSLEDFTHTEDAEDGGDVTVQFELKQYRDYGTKVIQIPSSTRKSFARAAVKKSRPVSKPPTRKTYTVRSGDCLWTIAKRQYGSGSKYSTIYSANRAVIESTAKRHGRASSSSGHWIWPGEVLIIP